MKKLIAILVFFAVVLSSCEMVYKPNDYKFRLSNELNSSKWVETYPYSVSVASYWEFSDTIIKNIIIDLSYPYSENKYNLKFVPSEYSNIDYGFLYYGDRRVFIKIIDSNNINISYQIKSYEINGYVEICNIGYTRVL